MESDEGIVLGAVKFKSTGRILKVYAKKQGLVSFYVSIQKKNNLQNICQPLQLIEFTYAPNTKSTLKTFSTVQISHQLNGIYSSAKKVSLAFFFVEILQQTLKEEVGNPTVHNFLEQSILQFNDGFSSAFIYHFLINYTKYLGVYPDIQSEGSYFNLEQGGFQHQYHAGFCLDIELSNLFKKCLYQEDLQSYSPQTRLRLLHTICVYYQVQVPNFKLPKSLDLLAELFFN